MVTRWRSSMLLLGMCVVAILIGVLRLATDHPKPPSSSSYSADPDGTLALYTWLSETAGVQPQRLTDLDVPQEADAALPTPGAPGGPQLLPGVPARGFD